MYASQEENVEDDDDGQWNGESERHLEVDPDLAEEQVVVEGPVDAAGGASIDWGLVGVAKDAVGSAAEKADQPDGNAQEDTQRNLSVPAKEIRQLSLYLYHPPRIIYHCIYCSYCCS